MFDENLRETKSRILILPRSTKNTHRNTGKKLFFESDDNEKYQKLMAK